MIALEVGKPELAYSSKQVLLMVLASSLTFCFLAGKLCSNFFQSQQAIFRFYQAKLRI